MRTDRNNRNNGNIEKRNVDGDASIRYFGLIQGFFGVAWVSTGIRFKKCHISTSGEIGSLMETDDQSSTLGILGIACSSCKERDVCKAVCEEAL